MTYRYFNMIYKAGIDEDIYIGQKIIQGSEKYEVKEDVRHPLFEKDKDVLEEVFSMKTGEMKDKINSI